MVQRAPGGGHTFSINCASPLQDSNRETAHRGKDMQGFQIFHSQGSQGTCSNLIQTTRRIKSSLYTIRSSGPFYANTAGEYGFRSPVLKDWQQLAKACLSGGNYLLWTKEFAKQCQATAERNMAQQVPIF